MKIYGSVALCGVNFDSISLKTVSKQNTFSKTLKYSRKFENFDPC